MTSLEVAMRRPVNSEDDFYTIEEFERLPEPPDGSRLELVRGRVVREPPPAEEHGWLTLRLGRTLYDFVEHHGLGLMLGETGYRLQEEPGTVRGPDLSFIGQARLEGGTWPVRRYRRLAPDLAVEVVSPWNRATELTEKAHDYLAAGTRLIWIVDPLRKRVIVHRSDDDVTVLSLQDELDGEDVLPGFRMPIARLFTS